MTVLYDDPWTPTTEQMRRDTIRWYKEVLIPRHKETDMTEPTRIVRREQPAKETCLYNLSEDPDRQPDDRFYFYETHEDLLLLVRPGSCFRFVSMRYPLHQVDKESTKQRHGQRAEAYHKWHSSVRDAVEYAMDKGREVMRYDTFGHLSVHIRRLKWCWPDCWGG